jgi:hypothetical protein
MRSSAGSSPAARGSALYRLTAKLIETVFGNTNRAAVDREEAAPRDPQRLCELIQPYQERPARTQ